MDEIPLEEIQSIIGTLILEKLALQKTVKRLQSELATLKSDKEGCAED